MCSNKFHASFLRCKIRIELNINMCCVMRRIHLPLLDLVVPNKEHTISPYHNTWVTRSMCWKSIKPIQHGVNMLIGVNEFIMQSRVLSLYNIIYDYRPSTSYWVELRAQGAIELVSTTIRTSQSVSFDAHFHD